MKKSLFLAAALFMSQFMVLSMPVIINDTGDWDGEIKADERGFLVYDNGIWIQRGANYKDEVILSFFDDFSPLIAGSGLNIVTCTYNDIGWIWPTPGRNVNGQLSFMTSNLVYSIEQVGNTKTITIGNDDENNVSEIVNFSPASSTISSSYSISSSTTTSTSYSFTKTGQNSISVTGTLLRIISLGHSISNAVTAGITRTLGYTSEITYSDTIGVTAGPKPFDDTRYSACILVCLSYFEKIYDVAYFNDLENDGLCYETDMTHLLIKYNFNPRPSLDIMFVEKGESIE